MRSLPADPVTFTVAPLTRPRARRRPYLSRRRVRALVTIGQLWIDAENTVWRIRQVHRRDLRGDGTVELERLKGPGLTVTFGELGARYQYIGPRD